MAKNTKAKEVFVSNGPARFLTGPGKITLTAGQYAIIISEWDHTDREMAGLSDKFKRECKE
jgi:hypothetical protein